MPGEPDAAPRSGPRRLVTPVRLLACLAVAATAATVLAVGVAPDAPASPPTLKSDASWRTGTPALPAVGSQDVAADLGRLTIGTDGRWTDMLRYALVDLRQLGAANGAVAAGAAPHWAYTWPRDAAFAVAADVALGQPGRALRTLGFLQRMQRPDGGFEARYKLDGSGVPDARPAQTDGAGWALWALGRVARSTTAADAAAHLSAVQPLLDRATAFALAQTSNGRRLPEPTPDYWEVRETSTTLGTAAALLAGLRGSVEAYTAIGDGQTAARVQAAADRFAGVVARTFGAGGYQRYAGWGGHDAATCLLLPPFTPATTPAALAAWRGYAAGALRPAGGLAPGASWKRDGVSWTPETALVAWTAAASGDRATAVRLLDWLDAHRTTWGSLPEKVLADGSPAGPAPLGWTAALAVLTVAELQRAG